MDALVAYLQMLGTLVDFTKFEPLTIKEFNELNAKIDNKEQKSNEIKNEK
jgi:hypothetical protein